MSDSPRTLQVNYSTGHEVGSIAVTYPLPVDQALLPAVVILVGVYLGQLCLAEEIVFGDAMPDGCLEAAVPLAEMLYDVRRWKDGQSLVPPPLLLSPPQRRTISLPRTTDVDDDGSHRALLLWSGGKDSSLSALLLKRNGYEPIAVHFTVNAGVEQIEKSAVHDLSTDIELDLLEVGYMHAEFLEFSTRYATDWNQFPRCNTVPFGRDMLLAALAAPLAAPVGARVLSMGHDHECRNAYFAYEGKSIPRNDVESTRGALLLERLLSRFIDPGLALLPPVSGLSEFRILEEMLIKHPGIMARASFCFWGDNCGRCAKCLRYYLAQRYLDVDVLDFAVNPLARGASPELDDIVDLTGTGLLFQRQILLCMSRLVERDGGRPGEDRLIDFAAHVYDQVRADLDSWEAELRVTGTDPQLPATWRYD